MLKWADDAEHASVSIEAAGNTKWAAQQTVAAPAEVHHVQVSLTLPQIPQMHQFLQLVVAEAVSRKNAASALGLTRDDVAQLGLACVQSKDSRFKYVPSRHL